MRSVTVSLPAPLETRTYPVLVGRGLLSDLSTLPPLRDHLTNRDLFLVSDRQVWATHGRTAVRGLEAAGGNVRGRFASEPGEAHKNLKTLEALWDAMVESGLGRAGCVVALGGGVVGDVAGLAAATYYRGVDLIQLPTTLLAMVDSSVGGKTGIDHRRGKNLIGAFHQPRAVVADLSTLDTLSHRELLSGFAEIIKAALIGDSTLFQLLEDRGLGLAEDAGALEEAISRAVVLKAKVVAADEREGGQRALLNLGHTLGHALEVTAGYGAWTHGEAVAAGLAFSARLSVRLGLLPELEAARITNLLSRFGYPLTRAGVPVEKIRDAIRFDKKSTGGAPRWVLLRAIGEAEWGVQVPPESVDATLNGLDPR